MHRNALALTLETLRVLPRVELAMANFYGLCAERSGDARDFWLGLEREERHHAESMRRSADIVTEPPDRFEPNRMFNVAAIQTCMAYVDSLVRRLRADEIPGADQYRLLTIARDLEQSVLEGKWNEIVKTADDEFQTLNRTIVSDTIAHKGKIVGRLAATPRSS